MANVLEDFQIQKQKVVTLTQQAVDFGWLAKERGQEIIAKIERDVLTIGVIGQMKCGKSTFLNSFVFGSDVLPAATTPMTATLSVITYGQQEKVVAEFYTKDEWEEQKLQALRNLAELEGNEVEKSKVQAAKELVDKADKLGSSLESYLGRSQEDTLENLVEYVGAEGKYVSITKAVRIYYPKEYLKGVEIVDTPGMNDPIVSREERTKEFLKKADVVLMMLYAGRPFDGKDRAILFEDVKKCGPGKVIIGINKYDIPYMNGDSEDTIRQYVVDEINKQCKQYKDDTISLLVQEREPILLSANMALLSQLPMEKINRSEDYRFTWDRYCSDFEISSQKQFREKSHMDSLGQAVIDLIAKEKGEILLVKPKNEILAAGQEKKTESEKKSMEYKNTITLLETPDSKLEERETGIDKAKKRLEKKLTRLDSTLGELFEENITTFKRTLENTAQDHVKRMGVIVDNWKLFENYNDIKGKLERETAYLTADIKGEFNESIRSLKSKIRKEMDEYFDDIESICGRHIKDFEFDDFLKGIQAKVNLSLETSENFNYNFERETGEKVKDFFVGIIPIVGQIIELATRKSKMQERITAFYRSINFDTVFVPVKKEKENIIQEIKVECNDAIINPLEEGIRKCREEKGEREQNLEKARAGLKKAEEDRALLEKQLQEIKLLG